MAFGNCDLAGVDIVILLLQLAKMVDFLKRLWIYVAFTVVTLLLANFVLWFAHEKAINNAVRSLQKTLADTSNISMEYDSVDLDGWYSWDLHGQISDVVLFFGNDVARSKIKFGDINIGSKLFKGLFTLDIVDNIAMLLKITPPNDSVLNGVNVEEVLTIKHLQPMRCEMYFSGTIRDFGVIDRTKCVFGKTEIINSLNVVSVSFNDIKFEHTLNQNRNVLLSDAIKRNLIKDVSDDYNVLLLIEDLVLNKSLSVDQIKKIPFLSGKSMIAAPVFASIHNGVGKTNFFVDFKRTNMLDGAFKRDTVDLALKRDTGEVKNGTIKNNNDANDSDAKKSSDAGGSDKIELGNDTKNDKVNSKNVNINLDKKENEHILSKYSLHANWRNDLFGIVFRGNYKNHDVIEVNKISNDGEQDKGNKDNKSNKDNSSVSVIGEKVMNDSGNHNDLSNFATATVSSLFGGEQWVVDGDVEIYDENNFALWCANVINAVIQVGSAGFGSGQAKFINKTSVDLFTYATQQLWGDGSKSNIKFDFKFSPKVQLIGGYTLTEADLKLAKFMATASLSRHLTKNDKHTWPIIVDGGISSGKDKNVAKAIKNETVDNSGIGNMISDVWMAKNSNKTKVDVNDNKNSETGSVAKNVKKVDNLQRNKKKIDVVE